MWSSKRFIFYLFLNFIYFFFLILGSLSIWNVKKPREFVHKTTPHSPNSSGGSSPNSCDPTTLSSLHTSCKPITQLSWNTNIDGEQLIIFAGGDINFISISTI